MNSKQEIFIAYGEKLLEKLDYNPEFDLSVRQQIFNKSKF